MLPVAPVGYWFHVKSERFNANVLQPPAKMTMLCFGNDAAARYMRATARFVAVQVLVTPLNISTVPYTVPTVHTSCFKISKKTAFKKAVKLIPPLNPPAKKARP